MKTKRDERRDDTDLVEVILIQLSHKARKIGVLEHPWKYDVREFFHILWWERLMGCVNGKTGYDER